MQQLGTKYLADQNKDKYYMRSLYYNSSPVTENGNYLGFLITNVSKKPSMGLLFIYIN
ncbi:hypothetical protein GCM10008018_25250 [Paenibacillus marchantiophytorum]|uniref:Uncharacterized protein n=1 Tax=Paenibacillus marchantiophytorum TaxID=1619310 RepID=A0ABQ1EMF4_9BACL|nr:hypothetical protein GCM10008018_25250 [Paenibacillus marchantiophytorum]